MKYNVLYEPVIPITWADGRMDSVGIRDAFLKAHEIRDIRGDNPLERYALLRLLVAFAMDMLNPEDSYDRVDLLEEGRFDPSVFDAYVAMCEADGPRFDLFDPEHPFLQSVFIENERKNDSSVARICLTMPSGDNPVFFEHRREAEQSESPQKAFRELCAHYCFCCMGGRGYKEGINGTPPVFVSIGGKTLFDRIILNMLSKTEIGSQYEYGEGRTPWRRKDSIDSARPNNAVSWIEGLTWMPRKVQFIQNDREQVERVFYQQGQWSELKGIWKDPFVPRRIMKNASPPVVPEKGRQIWRDVSTLLFDDGTKQSGTRYLSPQVVRCLSNIFEDNTRSIGVDMVALLTKKAKCILWYEDHLSLPLCLLNDPWLSVAFKDDVMIVESIQEAIYNQIQENIDKPRKDAKSKESRCATEARSYFLDMAHDYLLQEATNDLVSHKDSMQEHVIAFHEGIKKLVRETVEKIVFAETGNMRSMQNQLIAQKGIYDNVNMILRRRKGYA